MDKIKFMLPGFYEHFELNSKVIKLFEESPEIFIDNFSIGAVYGNFQFCIWDGGRSFGTYIPCRKEQIEKISNFYLEHNIPLRLIYTNPLIEKEHCYNRFCNLVTKICENENNEIVINSPVLEEYLRETYPEYKFISSTTKCLTQISETKKELNKDYYLICLDYNLNNNEKFLLSLPNEIRPKVELLINAICGPGCLIRKHHYDLNGLEHLSFGRYYSVPECSIVENTLHPLTCGYKTHISLERIYNFFVPNGFFNFKLEGRTLPDLEVACNYAKYFIKSDY